MKVVIIAGGKGTRISSINKQVPKSMIEINGKPIIEYQIELAKKYNLTDIIITIGYLGDIIKNYFKDGKKWGVIITYCEESRPLGTAGAFVEISDFLKEDFIVFYGDTIMDIDLNKMIFYHKKLKSDATLFLHPNDHPFDSDLVKIGENNKILQFLSKPHPENLVYKNLVNAALYILNPKVISLIPKNIKSDFGKDVFPSCIKNNLNIYGYISPEYIKDMGTPKRFNKVTKDLISGKVAKLNLINKRPCIFLDRDGVICEEVDLLHKPNQLKLIDGVVDALKYINNKGYLAVIVTNQPVVARNLCSIKELEYIHMKLETFLGNKGAYLDAIYFCPHHPDNGFPEENKKYKIVCECRKPKAGMFFKARKELNIDLQNSFMIGDRVSDIEAGNLAGLKKSYLIKRNKPNSLNELIKEII
jgi:D,D-heptose 1,7-bisphosphate phosphatase